MGTLGLKGTHVMCIFYLDKNPEIIKKNNCDTVLIITVSNPTTVNVSEAIEMYYSNNCNAIIGFGGGSSMDCAKAVGARIAKPKQSLAKMKGILKVRKKLPLLIAIPTTAGTGSETTIPQQKI